MAAEQVPGYRIVHMIGQGGQAQAYLAQPEADGTRVALKVLDSKLRHDRVSFERFLRDYKLLTAPKNEFVARSDLYSMGAVLYEMLAGQRIVESETPASMIDMHVNGPVPRLPAHLAGYQPIIDRLLAKKPDDRFQSARELFTSIAI